MPYGKNKKGKSKLEVEFKEFFEQFKKVPWSWLFNDFLPTIPYYPGKSGAPKKKPFYTIPQSNNSVLTVLNPLYVQFLFLIFIILILMVFGVN